MIAQAIFRAAILLAAAKAHALYPDLAVGAVARPETMGECSDGFGTGKHEEFHPCMVPASVVVLVHPPADAWVIYPEARP